MSNYLDFQESKRIAANFDIGKQRIDGATLDYSDLSDEAIMLAGVRQIKTNFSTHHSNKAKELEKKGTIPSALDWLKEKAAEYSGETLNMANYAGSDSWNFERGKGESVEKKAEKAIESMDMDQLERLLALAQAKKDKLAG